MATVYDNLKTMVLGIVAPIDYYAVYTATVVQVSGGFPTNFVDLNPANPRFSGLMNVPVLTGVCGCFSATLIGQKCLFSFLDGDPGTPYVLGFFTPSSSLGVIPPSASEVSINPTGIPALPQGAARIADTVTQTGDMVTWMSQVAGFINAAVPGTVTPAAPTTFGTITTGSTAVTIGN